MTNCSNTAQHYSHIFIVFLCQHSPSTETVDDVSEWMYTAERNQQLQDDISIIWFFTSIIDEFGKFSFSFSAQWVIGNLLCHRSPCCITCEERKISCAARIRRGNQCMFVCHPTKPSNDDILWIWRKKRELGGEKQKMKAVSQPFTNEYKYDFQFSFDIRRLVHRQDIYFTSWFSEIENWKLFIWLIRSFQFVRKDLMMFGRNQCPELKYIVIKLIASTCQFPARIKFILIMHRK